MLVKENSSGEFLEAPSFYRGKKVLVTGASGFLGKALVKSLSGQGCHLICASREISGNYLSTDFWEKNLPEVDFVFHFAAQTSLPKAEEDPENDFQGNVLPLLTLLRVCWKKKFSPAVIFAGTATQVGIPSQLPVDENVPPNPMTFYDLHKQMAEDYLKYFSSLRAVRGVSLRLTNIYGPGQNAFQPERGVLNQMIARALQGQPLKLYGEGNQIRDFLFIEDAIDAFLFAGMHADALNAKHYIIGSGKGYRLREAFEWIQKKAEIFSKIKVPLQFVPEPTPSSGIQNRNFIADSRSFRDLTGWSPKIDLPEGIERTMKGRA